MSSVDQIHPTIAGRRRFYKHVTIEQAPESLSEFRVLLDGRVLKTPQRNPLYLPNEALALLVAAEWDAQTCTKTGIIPASMPMMTLASTAIDQIAPSSTYVVDNCLRYLQTDSALFHASEDDRILLRNQKKHYAPTLVWLNKEFGVDLKSSYHMHGRITHSEEITLKIRSMVETLDHFALACLQSATMVSSILSCLNLPFIYVNAYLLRMVRKANRLLSLLPC
jgi:chaperone required for assembly of F1-ATPase